MQRKPARKRPREHAAIDGVRVNAVFLMRVNSASTCVLTRTFTHTFYSAC